MSESGNKPDLKRARQLANILKNYRQLTNAEKDALIQELIEALEEEPQK